MLKSVLADFSIIEFSVYGLIGYSGLILLLISTLLNPPTNRSLAGARIVFMSMSVVCLLVLSYASGNITTSYSDSTVIINTQSQVLNATNNGTLVTVWHNTTQTDQTTDKYILENPIWITLHFGFAAMLIMYILIQILNIFTKPE